MLSVNFIYLCVCARQGQHAGQSCRDYQDLLATQQDHNAMKTKKFFDVSTYYFVFSAEC